MFIQTVHMKGWEIEQMNVVIYRLSLVVLANSKWVMQDLQWTEKVRDYSDSEFRSRQDDKGNFFK